MNFTYSRKEGVKFFFRSLSKGFGKVFPSFYLGEERRYEDEEDVVEEEDGEEDCANLEARQAQRGAWDRRETNWNNGART